MIRGCIPTGLSADKPCAANVSVSLNSLNLLKFIKQKQRYCFSILIKAFEESRPAIAKRPSYTLDDSSSNSERIPDDHGFRVSRHKVMCIGSELGCFEDQGFIPFQSLQP